MLCIELIHIMENGEFQELYHDNLFKELHKNYKWSLISVQEIDVFKPYQDKIDK